MLTRKGIRALGQEVDTQCMLQARSSLGCAIMAVIGEHLVEIGEEAAPVFKRLRRARLQRVRRQAGRERFKQPLLFTGIPLRRYEYP